MLKMERKLLAMNYYLVHWFSAFLMLRPFNSVPHVVETPLPNHIIIFLLPPPNCNFATVVNQNVNIFGDKGLSEGL